MQRFAAMLVILLAGLSLLVSTEAYQIAQPANPAQVPIVSTDQGALKVTAGLNNPFTMVTMSGGRLMLDMQKGPNSGGYGFDAGSVNTLNKIIKVTNTTALAKNVTVQVTGNTVANLTGVTGHINGGGLSNPPFVLGQNEYVDINLQWTMTGVGASPGMKITVTGN